MNRTLKNQKSIQKIKIQKDKKINVITEKMLKNILQLS